MKKLLVLLLVISLGIFALAACNGGEGGGNGDSGKSTEGLIFKADEVGNYAVSGYTGTDTEVYIPSTYENAPVTAIAGNAFKANTAITAVHIAESVTEIGAKAFENCKGLTSVKFNSAPAALEIGNGAFSGCNALSELALPDSTVKIGVNAFSGCKSLTTTSGGATYVGKWLTTVDKTLATLDIASDTVGLADQAFSWSSYLSDIEIPSSVKHIGDGAFRGCTSLLQIKIDSNSDLETVGDSAFAGCKLLLTLSFPNSMTYIAENMLDECPKIESISIAAGCERYVAHDNVMIIDKQEKTLFYTVNVAAMTLPKDGTIEYIAPYSFRGRDKLETITIPASVKEIGENAFMECSKLSSCIIMDNSALVKIDKGAFGKTGLMRTFSLGSNSKLEEIGENAFIRSGINAFTLPATIKSIGKSAFMYCYYIKTLSFQEGYSYEILPDDFLYNCSELTSITLPDCITEIGDRAFKGSFKLASIVIPDSITKMGVDVFGSLQDEALVTTKIYCEAAAKPADWKESWYDGVLEVTWGYNA